MASTAARTKACGPATSEATSSRGGIFIVDHPLVAHHVTRMRREATKSSEFRGLVRKLAVLMYVGMGWVGVIAFKPLLAHLQTGGMVLLLAGGAAYTLGVPFYLGRRIPYHHSIWHFFVLTGSVLHFLAVLLYVLPDGPA